MPPETSPWGEIDWSETLVPGFEMVATPSHGGIMVSRDASFKLSAAARKCGFWSEGYLCFEEDADENVVLRELLDKKLWPIPERIKDREAFVAHIDQSLQTCHPQYWKAREAMLAKAENPPQRPRATPMR